MWSKLQVHLHVLLIVSTRSDRSLTLPLIKLIINKFSKLGVLSVL